MLIAVDAAIIRISTPATIDAASEHDYGKMVALRGTEIVRVPLSEALAAPKLLDPKVFETAEVFFG